jgi:hypothetical protein
MALNARLVMKVVSVADVGAKADVASDEFEFNDLLTC